jgi:hypothetical protein
MVINSAAHDLGSNKREWAKGVVAGRQAPDDSGGRQFEMVAVQDLAARLEPRDP